MSKKKLWLSIVAGVLAVAALGACVVVPNLPKKEAYVYSFDMIGYVDYYSMGSESYGMVTTDRVQTEMLTGTQTVAEILVYEGQQVRKGEVLYRYDTTLTDLEIERKELSIQQMEQNLKTAEKERKEMNNLKAMVVKEADENANEIGKSPKNKDPYEIYDGKGTSTDPYRVWLKTGYASTDVSPAVYEDNILEYLKAKKLESRDKTDVLENGDSVYVIFGLINKSNTKYAYEYGVCYTYQIVTKEETVPETVPASGNPVEPTQEQTDSTEPSDQATEPSDQATEPSDQATEPSDQATEPSTGATDPTEGTEAPTGQDEKSYAITMKFFQAFEQENDNVVMNSGYTSAEIKAMKTEKDAEIAERKFEIKVAKAELAIMEKEADSGEVVAQFEGVVESVLTPEEAREINAPLIKVTGGGGYYVEGSVSELDLTTIEVGQTVDVTSWDNYMTYQGTIVEVGQYPTEQENYYGAANVSYYPYKVFIDETADLQEGYYVSMVYQRQDISDQGIMYLENAFIRTENGESYVLVRNDEGVLEKRTVELGDTSGGYMSQILSGLSETDWVAFPYGKEAVEGAPAVEGTWDNLYGY